MIVGIALPVILILAISIFMLVSRATIAPEHNFVFSKISEPYKNGYYIPNIPHMYRVTDNKLVVDMAVVPLHAEPNTVIYYPDLFMYDVKNDTVRTITLEEAKKLSLDPGPSSIDGYTVGYEYGHNGIFEIFGSNNSNQGHFIMKGGAKKKLSINADDYWNNNITFIGWVK
jgi:hypothetical protein